MWLDYMHDNEESYDSRNARIKSKAIADFARMQQRVLDGCRKKHLCDAEIVEALEETMLVAIMDERNFK